MDYHVKPLGRTCAATGEPLVPGSVCRSVLVERDGEQVRLDFSEVGWSGPPPGMVGQWRVVVPEPERTGRRPLDTEALLRYFEQLSESPNPVQETFRYVIALLLLQKRRLQLDGTRHDGDIEYLQLIGSHSEGPFEVRNQHLSDEEITNLQNELSAQLAAEWS